MIEICNLLLFLSDLGIHTLDICLQRPLLLLLLLSLLLLGLQLLLLPFKLILEALLRVLQTNYLFAQSCILVIQSLDFVLLIAEELFGLVQCRLSFFALLGALFEAQTQVQLLLRKCCVLLDLLLQIALHFIDFLILLLICCRLFVEVLQEILRLDLLLFILALGLLGQ